MKNDSLLLFASYIKRTLYNARIDYLRKQRRIQKHEVMAGKAYDNEVSSLVSEELPPLEQIATKTTLQQAFATLSQVEVYVLYHTICLGEPAVNSAEHLGIAEKSVSRIKLRALRKLRCQLERMECWDGF